LYSDGSTDNRLLRLVAERLYWIGGIGVQDARDGQGGQSFATGKRDPGRLGIIG
jgi:hypothetical protein